MHWAQDLSKLIAEGPPAEELNLTNHTQPVMQTAAYACYRAWQEEAGGPLAPSIVAGATASASTRRWWRPARWPSAMRCRWYDPPQAMRNTVPVGEGGMTGDPRPG